MYKVIIADDEEPARKRLKRLLKKHESSIKIIGEAETGPQAFEIIRKEAPDFVFLDIQMPGMTGFEVLQKLENKPKVVFTTAYEEYALKAFEENSIDYLLKPIEEERFEQCIDKIKSSTKTKSNLDLTRLAQLLKEGEPARKLRSIPVKKGDRIFIINFEDITHFEAKDKYVFIHTTDKKEHLIDFTLNHLEKKLPSEFIRVHRGFIINKAQLKEVQKYYDGKFVLIVGHQERVQIISGGSYGKEIKKLIEF